jgi:hypothetical protein
MFLLNKDEWNNIKKIMKSEKQDFSIFDKNHNIILSAYHQEVKAGGPQYRPIALNNGRPVSDTFKKISLSIYGDDKHHNSIFNLFYYINKAILAGRVRSGVLIPTAAEIERGNIETIKTEKREETAEKMRPIMDLGKKIKSGTGEILDKQSGILTRIIFIAAIGSGIYIYSKLPQKG